MMNDEIKDLLVILGFEKSIRAIPLMKEVRRNFLKLAILKHPDKPGGVKADFQKLKDAYDRIGKLIEETEQDDLNDTEETVARKLFRETNFEKINLYSVTIAILTSQADAWEKVLMESYGVPTEGKDKSNGKKFTIESLGSDSDKGSSIYVTLWKKEKVNRSTLLIDAKRNQSKSIQYVEEHLPVLYEKVVEISPAPAMLPEVPKARKNVSKSGLKSRKRSSSIDPMILSLKVKDVSCRDCLSKFTNTVELNKHRLYSHEENFHPCNECEFKGKNNEELKKHIENAHILLQHLEVQSIDLNTETISATPIAPSFHPCVT